MKNDRLPLVKTILHYFTVLFLLIFLGSCDNTKEVLIYSRDLDTKTITIGDQLVTLDSTASFTTISLDPGEHPIESGGLLPGSIEVSDDCLIGSSDAEFVIFPVLYTNDKPSPSLIPMSPIVIGDSIVIYYGAESQSELMSKMSFIMPSFENCADCPKLPSTLKLLKSSTNVYRKSWDYTVDNIPDEIYISKAKSKVKKAICELTLFQLFAAVSDEFSYENIESAGKLDTIKRFNKLLYGI